MTHSHLWHDSFTRVPWIIHMCHMPHSLRDVTYWHVWHDSFIYSTWLIHMCAYARHDSFICVRHDIFMGATCLNNMSDMTYSHVWHELFAFLTWLIHSCDATQWYVWQDLLIMWHDLFVCLTWLIHTFDMAYPHVRHDSFMCATWLNHMCFMTHSYAARTWSFDMGKKTEATWNWRELSALREVLIRLWTIMIVPLLTGAARCLYICLHICVHVCECICMHNCTWIGMYEYVYVYIIENELMILLP